MEGWRGLEQGTSDKQPEDWTGMEQETSSGGQQQRCNGLGGVVGRWLPERNASWVLAGGQQ